MPARFADSLNKLRQGGPMACLERLYPVHDVCGNPGDLPIGVQALARLHEAIFEHSGVVIARQALKVGCHNPVDIIR
jgi:hypothetical protein